MAGDALGFCASFFIFYGRKKAFEKRKKAKKRVDVERLGVPK
jgi:hypothetical protein